MSPWISKLSKRRSVRIAGILLILAALGLGALYLYVTHGGMIARQEPPALEKYIAGSLLDWSISSAARDQTSPFKGDADSSTVAAGMETYKKVAKCATPLTARETPPRAPECIRARPTCAVPPSRAGPTANSFISFATASAILACQDGNCPIIPNPGTRRGRGNSQSSVLANPAATTAAAPDLSRRAVLCWVPASCKVYLPYRDLRPLEINLDGQRRQRSERTSRSDSSGFI